MIRKYIIVADDSIKGFDEEIARLEREWGAEEIEPCVSEGVCREDEIRVLDKIRAKIENHCGLAKEDRCKYCYRCNNVMGVKEILDIIDKYKTESEEQPKTGEWIPVSERLPKSFEFVNCTCHSLIDDREDWVIETVYLPQPSVSPYSDWGNIPMLNSGDCEVVAWMHRDIPEPYNAESEGKQ